MGVYFWTNEGNIAIVINQFFFGDKGISKPENWESGTLLYERHAST